MVDAAFARMHAVPELPDHDRSALADSTNAEEAMHLKLYSALGKHLGLLDGLRSLVAFAEYYRTQFDAKKSKLIICTLGSIN